MKIKRKADTPATPKPIVPANLDTPPAESRQSTFSSKGTGRILVAVTSTGTVDFARMNKDARKQLIDLVKSEQVQKQLGFGPPAATFDPEQCKHLYTALGKANVFLGKLLLKMPDQALPALLYTDEEKDELGPATSAMLDAYAPAWLAQHQALAAWAAVYASITMKKFQDANEIAQDVRRRQVTTDRPAATDVFVPDAKPAN